MIENWVEVRKEIITQPVSIKLERGQKGGYGWEIKIYGESLDYVLFQVEKADTQLRESYVVTV